MGAEHRFAVTILLIATVVNALCERSFRQPVVDFTRDSPR